MVRGRVVIAACLLAGCTAWQEVRVHGGLPANIAVGDRAVVSLRSGESVSGTVNRVEPDALVVDGRRIDVAAMSMVEVREISGGRTAGTVGGGVGTFILGTLLAVGAIVLIVVL